MALADLRDDEKYELWKYDAGQNNRRLAKLLSVPEGTVHSWVSRGRWRARARADDAQDFADVVSWSRRALAQQLITAVHVNHEALNSVYGKDGKPLEGAPTPTAVNAADKTLARFGIAPQRHIVFESHEHEQASQAQIDAVIASRDHDAILALLQGAPLPIAHQGDTTTAGFRHGHVDTVDRIPGDDIDHRDAPLTIDQVTMTIDQSATPDPEPRQSSPSDHASSPDPRELSAFDPEVR